MPHPARFGRRGFASARRMSRRIAARLYISDFAVNPGRDCAIFDGPEGTIPDFLWKERRVLRVDITKAAGQSGENTALGKARSWLAEVLREGETVTVCGPNARTIVRLHLEDAGFSADEADRFIRGG